MMTLTEFLLARIAEDEAAAREAMPSAARWTVGLERSADRRGVVAHLVIPTDSIDDESGVAWDEVARSRWLTSVVHIARHDPARVLAECEAKRRILEWHAEGHYCSDHGNMESWYSDEPCPTLRVLALPYADHSDYDESWRP